MQRRAYYDAEPRYQKEKTQDWYQQKEKTNQRLKEMLPEYLSPKKSVLEVGCGGGWLAEFILGASVKSYAGFDFAETAVANTRARLKNFEDARLWRADALSPQIYTKKYDIIIAHQFFHCLIGADRIKWLTYCRSALYAEGVVIFSSNIGIPAEMVKKIDPQSKQNKNGNRYYADESEIKLEIEAAGMELEEIIHPEDFSAIFVASPIIS